MSEMAILEAAVEKCAGILDDFLDVVRAKRVKSDGPGISWEGVEGMLKMAAKQMREIPDKVRTP